jgi:hypothetical protein
VPSNPRRELTSLEAFVLAEVCAYWGEQNTADKVFFSDRNEAVLFVTDSSGDMPCVVGLTVLGEMYDVGTISLDELREQVKGADGK